MTDEGTHYYGDACSGGHHATDCPDGPHRPPRGPNEDVARCPKCGGLSYEMRPEYETYGEHLADCSLPRRHEGYCQPGGSGHPSAAVIRGYWPDPNATESVTLPEPPDNTRLEFECGTDLYAIHRDDESSRRAGYPIGDGGETWCVYGSDVPMTWTAMVDEFGTDALALAVRLVPVAEDLPNREQWPTEIWYREDGTNNHG
jgi:hypothetical protein